MAFNWAWAVGVFLVSVAVAVPGYRVQRGRVQRQQDRYLAWVQHGRGWWFGESEIVSLTYGELVAGAVCLAVLVGFVVPALGRG